jgi:hypothetical protein
MKNYLHPNITEIAQNKRQSLVLSTNNGDEPLQERLNWNTQVFQNFTSAESCRIFFYTVCSKIKKMKTLFTKTNFKI